MAIEEFWKSVKLGERLRLPSLVTEVRPNAPPPYPVQLDLWLTKRSIAGYNPDDFEFLSEPERQELDEAVQQFRSVTEQVSPTEPVTPAQAAQAGSAFETILGILTPSRFSSAEHWVAAKVIQRFKDSPFCPPNVVEDLEYMFDEDSTGETILMIWVIVKDDVARLPSFFETANEIQKRLKLWLESEGVEVWPHIRFRSVSEQRGLQDAGTR